MTNGPRRMPADQNNLDTVLADIRRRYGLSNDHQADALETLRDAIMRGERQVLAQIEAISKEHRGHRVAIVQALGRLADQVGLLPPPGATFRPIDRPPMPHEMPYGAVPPAQPAGTSGGAGHSDDIRCRDVAATGGRSAADKAATTPADDPGRWRDILKGLKRASGGRAE